MLPFGRVDRVFYGMEPVIPFGNTGYDSRIFDHLYRTFGTEDGGTILSAEWLGELKCFKTDVPYQIISNLIRGKNVGPLCNNYNWVEVNPDLTVKETVDYDWSGQQSKAYTVPSNYWCLELASKASYSTIDELFKNAERIKEYCKQLI